MRSCKIFFLFSFLNYNLAKTKTFLFFVFIFKKDIVARSSVSSLLLEDSRYCCCWYCFNAYCCWILLFSFVVVVVGCCLLIRLYFVRSTFRAFQFFTIVSGVYNFFFFVFLHRHNDFCRLALSTKHGYC